MKQLNNDILELIYKYNHFFLFKDVLKQFKSKISFHIGGCKRGINFHEAIVFQNVFYKVNLHICGVPIYYHMPCVLYPPVYREHNSCFDYIKYDEYVRLLSDYSPFITDDFTNRRISYTHYNIKCIL